MYSDEDAKVLADFDQRLDLVRMFTRQVAEGWSTGLYVWGEGGIGKSYTITQELDLLKRAYKVTNTRISGRGLFDLLAGFPDIVHLIEDQETLLKNPIMSSLLRSALWSVKRRSDVQHRERLITWQTANGREEAQFRGGIILTMNSKLDNFPELRAVKTRIAHLHLQPTEQELGAKMRQIASNGFMHGHGELDPQECMEVCNYALRRLKEEGLNLDIRLMVNGFGDRMHVNAGDTRATWQEMLDARIMQSVRRGGVSRQDEMANDRKIAAEIFALKLGTKKTIAMWKEKTGKGKSAYYDRLKEL